MKAFQTLCITVTISLLTLIQPLHATNNYFLPGDAFFHSILTLESIQKREREKEAIYDYRFVCEPAFCGYAGYSELKLDKQNKELAKNIHKAYFEIRKSRSLKLQRKTYKTAPLTNTEKPSWNPENFEETNGLSLLFYNEDYDWKRRNIAVKYNEDWLGDLKKFGFGGGRYCEFVSTADAVVASWARGKYIPPLNVQLPDTPIEKYKTVNTPMLPKGKLKALILFDRNYKQYFEMRNHKDLIEVTNKGMNRYIIHQKQWKLFKDVYGEDE